MERRGGGGLGVTHRPMYMASRWPLAATCMITPTIDIIDADIRPGFLPQRSATCEAIRAPKKQPACSVDTMLADRFAWATELRLVRPYFLVTVRTNSPWLYPRQGYARHERFHCENTSNDTCFHSKKHTAKACLQTRQSLSTRDIVGQLTEQASIYTLHP